MSGSGNGSLNVTASKNTGSPRSGSMSVLGEGVSKNVEIFQAQGALNIVVLATATSSNPNGFTPPLSSLNGLGYQRGEVIALTWNISQGGSSMDAMFKFDQKVTKVVVSQPDSKITGTIANGMLQIGSEWEVEVGWSNDFALYFADEEQVFLNVRIFIRN